MTPLTFGILGAGSIGMRHAKNLQEMGQKTIVYDPQLANGVTRDEVIDKADAILICTPTTEHYSDLFDCLHKRVPIFCEKPLAIPAHPSMSRVNMVGYNLRFHPCVVAAKQIIGRQDLLGKPKQAAFVCGQKNTKYRDSVLYNWSHEIDLALYLLGDGIVTKSLLQSRDEIDVAADLTISHHGGVTSNIHLDYIMDPEVRQFVIECEKGLIYVDLLKRVISTSLGRNEFGGSYDDDYREEMRTFASLVEGRAMFAGYATGRDGIGVIEICQQAEYLAKREAA